jgi:hypothetical protein
MDRYRVKPGMRVDLGTWDTKDRSAFDGDKSAGKAAAKDANRRLEALQELLYAEGKQRVTTTSGGCIRRRRARGR